MKPIFKWFSYDLSLFNHALFKKLVLGLLFIAFVFGIAGFLWSDVFITKILRDYAGNIAVDTSRLLIGTFDQKLDEKIFFWEAYFHNSQRFEAIRQEEKKFAKIPNKELEISKRDQLWIKGNLSEEKDEWYGEIINHPESIALREYLNKNGFYDADHFGISEIFFSNLDGAVVFLSGKTSDYYQADEEWWQRGLQDGIFIGDVEYDVSAGVYGLTIGIRIDDGDQPVGVVKIVYKLEEAKKLFQELVTTQVRNSRVRGGLLGAKILSHDHRLIYSIGNLDIDDSYKTVLKSADLVGDNYYCCVTMTVGNKTKNILLSVAHSRGHQRYPGIRWALVSEYDTDILYAPLRKIIYLAFVMVIAICLAVLTFSFFYFYPIAWSLNRLETAMRRVVMGDLSVRSGIPPQADLGNLASDFDLMIDELSRSRKLRQDFVSTATHSLKAPLTGVKWNIEILLEDKKAKLTTMAKEILREVYSTCSQMLVTVTEVLRANKIDKVAGIEKAVVFNPVEYLKELEPTFKKLAKSRGRKISFDYENEKMNILMDKDIFKDIVENLITNAVKFSRHGGEVKVSLKKLDDSMSLWVIDQGIGIPAHEQKNLFTEFFRASNAASQHIEGTGLGLYIAKSETESCGGRLNFESEEGKGSTFILTIPLSRSLK